MADTSSSDAPLLQVGLAFYDTATFSAADIVAFARLVGDTNALHLDAEAAAASRFGGLIASGAHTGSIMMGCAAGFFSRYWPNVGLGYTVELRRPVPAGSTVRIEWCVTALERSSKLGGVVATLEGRLINESGEVAVTGSCQALVLGGAGPSSGGPIRTGG